MSKRGFNFNSIPAPKLQRSSFDLSHEHKLSCGMGELIPIECIECLPGDTFKITPTMMMRLQALVSPMMQRVDASILWFKVPIRLIWDDFEEFITGGQDGTSAPIPPFARYLSFIEADALRVGSLSDYLGLPLPYRLNSSGSWEFKVPTNGKVDNQRISLLPFRAYQCVYNHYFRDQNLELEVEFDKGSGKYDFGDLDNLAQIRRRAWRKDYFTSALPDPQRGAEVTIPLVGDAPVTIEHFDNGSTQSLNTPFIANGNGFDPDSNKILTQTGPSTYQPTKLVGTADLDNLSVIGISALRTAFKLQQFLERNNVAGSRYIEQILAHFGVRSSDARLQRPEFLGGGSVPVVISEVETTADSSDGGYNSQVGDLAGKAKAVGGLGTVSAFCEEHCFIMGILSIMPKASYSQGLAKMWSRFDKFDYFWSEFQHVGEQAVANKELYLDLYGDSDPDAEFGYQSRYSEYKYSPDRVSGDLRTSLSFWHQGRLFDSMPNLNEEFVQCDPSDRVFAASDSLSNSQHVIVDLWLKETAIRPMGRYATPKLT